MCSTALSFAPHACRRHVASQPRPLSSTLKLHDSPGPFLQHSSHDSPALSLQHSRHYRVFTWSAAPCNNCTPQAAGADFGVTDSSTGNVETWSDLKSSIAGVGDRTDQVETLLGLARRQDESDPASLPDLIASLVEVNELVAPLLQASINQTRDSGAAVVSAIRAANVATVAGLSPPEVSVAGGEMISVGGRGFIPGLDGLCEPLSPSPPFPHPPRVDPRHTPSAELCISSHGMSLCRVSLTDFLGPCPCTWVSVAFPRQVPVVLLQQRRLDHADLEWHRGPEPEPAQLRSASLAAPAGHPHLLGHVCAASKH